MQMDLSDVDRRLIHGFLDPSVSQPVKRHLDRFNRFLQGSPFYLNLQNPVLYSVPDNPQNAPFHGWS